MLYESYNAVIFGDYLSLNPCFVGKCSTSENDGYLKPLLINVLILVLLENALRENLDKVEKLQRLMS